MYCRNCGKQIDDQAVYCVGCGVPPTKAKNFCQCCGQPTDPNAVVCPGCSTQLATGATSASDEKVMALLAHLLGLFTGFIGPLVIWLIKGKESAFVDDQAKESLNFQISLIIYYIISFILMFVLIGIVLMIALGVFALVEIIIASIAANDGKYFRYPLCIRFIK